jgi:hypothetical protein
MFWFIFIFALLAYGVCHVANVYRQKSLENGESKIGLFEPSICPFCKKCKLFVFVSFVITLFTAILITFSGDSLSEWSFLALDHNSWEIVHIIIGLTFVITLLIYFYIHTEALTAGLKRLFKFIN